MKPIKPETKLLFSATLLSKAPSSMGGSNHLSAKSRVVAMRAIGKCPGVSFLQQTSCHGRTRSPAVPWQVATRPLFLVLAVSCPIVCQGKQLYRLRFEGLVVRLANRQVIFVREAD